MWQSLTIIVSHRTTIIDVYIEKTCGETVGLDSEHVSSTERPEPGRDLGFWSAQCTEKYVESDHLASFRNTFRIPSAPDQLWV